LEFLKSPKKRAKFIAQLAHFKHLDPQCIVTISISFGIGLYRMTDGQLIQFGKARAFSTRNSLAIAARSLH